MTQTPEEIVKAQANLLGGGWRMEEGVVPVVVLTTEEAAALIKKHQRQPIGIEIDYEEKIYRFAWEDIRLIYEGGIETHEGHPSA